MPDNGAGSYELPSAPIENGQTGDATPVQDNFDDIADALSARLMADGTKTPTANQPMGGFKHTNVAVASARTDYARASQVADSSLTYGGVAGGTANAITLSPSPAIAAYALGQRFFFITGAAANSGAVKVDINSLGDGPLKWPDGTALVDSDLPANAGITISVVDISSPTEPVFHLQTQTRSTATQAATLAILKAFNEPGHRLTLTTAVAVTTADVTAQATIYWTPGKHNVAPVYNGSAWILQALAEKSLALDSASGHTGYHQAGKNFDVFLDYNAGTPRLVTSPAWSSDTARSDAISRDATYGWYVNSGSMTVKFDASSSTATLAAGAGLYLGTFRASVDGQTEDSVAKRFLWNTYNRVLRPMRVLEATDTWNYTTATIRQANGAAANQLDFVRGLDEDTVSATVIVSFSNSTGGIPVATMIGLDSTTAMAAGCLAGTSSTPVFSQAFSNQARWSGLPGIGRHYLAWLEYSAATGTTTWVGDNGVPARIQSGISGELFA